MKKQFKNKLLGVFLSLVIILGIGVYAIDPPDPIKIQQVASIDPPDPIAPPTEIVASIDPPDPIAPPVDMLASIDPPDPIAPRG